MLERVAMTDLAFTIRNETVEDALAIERLHERTFGPGRYALTAYRLRERVGHDLGLSFTARVGTLLVGSVWMTPILIGSAKAMLLGPLTVEPPFRGHGIAVALIQRALAEAKAEGHRLVLLVGDEPYYGKRGFMQVPKGQIKFPGPVDPARLMLAELEEGAFAGVTGLVRPDWDATEPDEQAEQA